MATKNGYRQLRTARPGNLRETVKILFKYMRNYRLRLFVVVVAVVTSALTRVASNYFFKPIINDYVAPYVGMENVDLTGFIKMLGFMALIYALVGFLAVVVLCKVYMGIALEKREKAKEAQKNA